MAIQQLRLEGLSEEGRQMAKHPELKPKPKPEGRGMAFAIAHLDELLQQAEKKEQAQRRYQLYSVIVFLVFGKYRDHHHLKYLYGQILFLFHPLLCWAVFP